MGKDTGVLRLANNVIWILEIRSHGNPEEKSFHRLSASKMRIGALIIIFFIHRLGRGIFLEEAEELKKKLTKLSKQQDTWREKTEPYNGVTLRG